MFKTFLLFFPLFLAGCCSSPVTLNDKRVAVEIENVKYIAGTDLKSNGWLNIENCESPVNENTVNTNLTDSSYKQWTHFNGTNIQEIKLVKDTPEEKIVYLKIKCSAWYKEDKDYDVYFLEVNLITRKDIPCLLVYQRVCNPAKEALKINFGSYTSGVVAWGIDSNTVKVDPANKAWMKIVKGSYIWLEKGAHSENKKGLGIIEFGKAGFCLFLGHRIFWGYGNSSMLPPGKYLETKTALLLADKPQDVLNVYEKIKDIKFNDFISSTENNSSEK